MAGRSAPGATSPMGTAWVLAVVALLLAALGGAGGRVLGLTGDPVLINELLVSHTGEDTTEFFELYGTPGLPLAGLSLVVVEGDGSAAGTIDLRVDLADDAALGGNGFFLIGNPSGLSANYGVTPDLSLAGANLVENGSQTVALVATASIGQVGTVVSGTEDVRDAVGLTDAGPSDRWFWNAPVVGPDDGFLPAGARRLADGVDTNAAADWALADDLLGPANTPTAATPYLPSATATPTPTPTPVADPGPGTDVALVMAALEDRAASGDVATSKVKALMAHLALAERFGAQGKHSAADAQLRAFANQVRGLSPRWVTPAAADLLVTLVHGG